MTGCFYCALQRKEMLINTRWKYTKYTLIHVGKRSVASMTVVSDAGMFSLETVLNGETAKGHTLNVLLIVI